MATPQDKFKKRFKMFKVTTGFKYDSDTASSVHFVWAQDADDALRIVARHAHKCKLLDIEMYDQVNPDDSENWHRPEPGRAPKVYASERDLHGRSDARVKTGQVG